MDAEVAWNDATLIDYLIGYTREDNICDSNSMIDVTLSINCAVDFDFGDIITVKEGGPGESIHSYVKKGTYKITTIEKSFPKSEITIHAVNSQLNLENHFVTERYDIQDTPTLKTRYWIEKFLTEAGVVYSFTATGDGEYLPSDLVLGGTMAGDIIKQLLQYSGWYMRYDADGVAVIGNLDYDSSAYSATIHGEDIISLRIVDNDSMLRNRAVVWGMNSSILEDNGWVFADISVNTPWNYDDLDKRTVLLSNAMISDSLTAQTIAKKMLDEFTKPNIVKEVRVIGFVNVMVGDRIFVSSKYLSKICTVTSISVTCTQDGSITNLTLDERCPKMIGYFSYGGYVYVGTTGSGVWRKPLKYAEAWENFSTGLLDLGIIDLSIAGGVMACVTSSNQLYVRYPNDTEWKLVAGFPLTDNDNVTYTTIDGTVVSCSVDRNNGTVYAGLHYQISDSGFRSWVGKVTPSQVAGAEFALTSTPVTVSGNNNYYLTDLDSNSYAVYVDAFTPITVTTSGTGNPPTEVFGGLHITRNTGNTVAMNEYGNYNTSYNIMNFGSSLIENFSAFSTACYGKYMFSVRTGIAYRNDVIGGELVQITLDTSNEPKVHAYSTSLAYGVYNGLIGTNIRVKEYNFNTQTYNTYTITETQDTGRYQKLLVSAIIGENIYIVYCNDFYAKLYYRIFNIVSHTFSSMYTIFTDNTYQSMAAEGQLLYDDLVGVFYFWHKVTVPRTVDWYTFRIKTDGSVETIFIQNSNLSGIYGMHLGPADFTTDTIFCIKNFTGFNEQGRIIARIDADLTVSDIYTFASDISKLSSSKTAEYVTLANGNVYDLVGNLLGDLGTTSAYFYVSHIADDYDDALIVFNTVNNVSHESKVERHKFYPTHTSVDIISDLYIVADRTCFLWGERIWVADNVFVYTGTNDDLLPVDEVTSTTYYIPELLEHKTTDFTFVHSTMAENVDASQDYPVAVYGGDIVFNSGSLEVYKPPDIFNYVNLITYSSGGIGSTAYVYDFRSFSQLVPGSGYLRRSVFTRNTLVNGMSYLQLIDYDLVTIPDYIGYTIDGGWVSFSGTAKNIEVGNYGDNPYFFVSTLGSPSSFYQKDKYDNVQLATDFEEFSVGLPNSEISIIRLDDLV